MSRKDLLGRLKSGASRARQKAEDSMEKKRIRSQIKTLTQKNEALYRAIGEGVYRCAADTIARRSFEREIGQIEANYETQKELYLKAALLSGEGKGLEKGMAQIEKKTGWKALVEQSGEDGEDDEPDGPGDGPDDGQEEEPPCDGIEKTGKEDMGDIRM